MNARPAVVGAFILGAIGLCVLGLIFFGGKGLFTKTTRVVVFFSDSVAGLDVGAPVTFRGVRVGSVQSVAISFSVETMSARIPVYLEIESSKVIWEGRRLTGTTEDYAGMVRAGLRAQLALQSFVTGQFRVDLDFLPGTPAQLVGTNPGVPEIPTVSSDLEKLRNQLAGLPLRELADTAQKALLSLTRLSDHIDATIDPFAKSAQRTVDAATQTLQTADEAVKQLQGDASRALHDADSLLVDARGQVDARGGELGRALREADRAIRQAETLIDSINSLAEPRSAFRGDLEAAMHDLAASAGSLRNLAETLEQNPNALFMGRASR